MLWTSVVCLLSIHIPFLCLQHHIFVWETMPLFSHPAHVFPVGWPNRLPLQAWAHKSDCPISTFHSLTIMMSKSDRHNTLWEFYYNYWKEKLSFHWFQGSGSASSNFVTTRGRICQWMKLIQIEAELETDPIPDAVIWAPVSSIPKTDLFMNLVPWANIFPFFWWNQFELGLFYL